jgi:hypothetical protein
MAKISHFFFYRPNGFQAKYIRGLMRYRDNSMPEDVWYPLPHPIDRLLQHVQVLTGTPTQKELFHRTGIQNATCSRIRNGKPEIPRAWLVILAEYSGLTLTDLYAIGGIKPTTKHYTQFNQEIETEEEEK